MFTIIFNSLSIEILNQFALAIDTQVDSGTEKTILP